MVRYNLKILQQMPQDFLSMYDHLGHTMRKRVNATLQCPIKSYGGLSEASKGSSLNSASNINPFMHVVKRPNIMHERVKQI